MRRIALLLAIFSSNLGCPNPGETPICGDGIIDAGEQCDDGNTLPGDGCDAQCQIEVAPPICGDGIVNAGEQCDDGANNSDTTPDACRTDCTLPICGDGVVDSGEQCDDGNNVGGDGCEADCIRSLLAVDTGEDHTCALLASGAVRCWGLGDFGVLGYGNEDIIGDDELPADAGDVNVGGDAIQISTGDFHTCALLDTGAVRCWGLGDDGLLGYGNTITIGDDEDPAVAGDVNVGGNVVQVSAGSQSTCVLLDTGAVRCWGRGLAGQLGYGNLDIIGDDETPADAGDVGVL